MSLIKPEKLVEQQVRGWCLKQNISVHVFDSKATWSPSAKTFKRTTAMRVGVSDLIGLDSSGLFVAIELKAPGKEKVCRLEQKQFLEDVINHNGFGCVVSSVEQLESLYLEFKSKKNKTLLLNALPKKVLVNGKVMTLA